MHELFRNFSKKDIVRHLFQKLRISKQKGNYWFKTSKKTSKFKKAKISNVYINKINLLLKGTKNKFTYDQALYYYKNDIEKINRKNKFSLSF